MAIGSAALAAARAADFFMAPSVTPGVRIVEYSFRRAMYVGPDATDEDVTAAVSAYVARTSAKCA
jgi:hypothetical protein